MQTSARFETGARVVTELYGAGKVVNFYRDVTIGWVYKIVLAHVPSRLASDAVWLVEDVLEREPAVVQLAKVLEG